MNLIIFYSYFNLVLICIQATKKIVTNHLGGHVKTWLKFEVRLKWLLVLKIQCLPSAPKITFMWPVRYEFKLDQVR